MVVKHQGPMLLVLLNISDVANLALVDLAPTLTGSNKWLMIIKRDNFQLNQFLKMGDRVFKGYGNDIKLYSNIMASKILFKDIIFKKPIGQRRPTGPNQAFVLCV
jgi:hypothetical protein